LERHLSDNEIEELVLSASSGKGQPDLDFAVQSAADLHLKRCASCQSKVRAQKGAMGQLALLKSDMLEEPGLQCPPAESWVGVAAGTPAQDAEIFLNHAAICDYCGPLFRQAVEDLALDLTPQEEAQIASLSSSTEAWQTKLAGRLHREQGQPRAGSLTRYGFTLSRATMLTSARLAIAAAVVGLIVLGVRDYRQLSYFSSQINEKSSDIQRLELEVKQQKSKVDELSAKLGEQTGPRRNAPAQRSMEGEIASVTLTPGLTRGSGEMKRLANPLGAELVKISLRVAEIPEGELREELLTVDRRQIWAQESLPSVAEKNSKSLVLMIPPYLLTPDDYQITLSRKSSSGIEEVASYVFRVTR
jgi:hypothetical protein